MARVVLVGNLAPKSDFPLQAVVTRELTLYGSCASAGEYPLCLDLIARGVIGEKDVAELERAVAEAKAGIGAWLDFYNRASEHPSVYVNEENRLC